MRRSSEIRSDTEYYLKTISWHSKNEAGSHMAGITCMGHNDIVLNFLLISVSHKPV